MSKTLKDNDLVPAIFYIPKGSTKVVVTATVNKKEWGDEPKTAECEYYADEVYDAIVDGDYWQSENVMYTINEDYLKELAEKEGV